MNSMTNTWRTKDGELLLIEHMGTGHIKNCIAMLEKNMPTAEEDITECADFPESMDWQPSCYTIAGAKHYRKKIKQFQDELDKRKPS